MGNCLFCIKRDANASRNMVWDCEEYYWESPGNEATSNDENDINVERKMLLPDGEERGCSSSSPSPSSREFKLKLTRKELEDLVQGMEVRGLSLEEVLAKLINGNAQFQVAYHRSWRPVLQSIPEVNGELSC